MTDDLMTNEERINSDKLDSYFKEDISVHILLKRTNSSGENIFLNGSLISKATERVWVMNERKLGQIRVAISEIKDVDQLREC